MAADLQRSARSAPRLPIGRREAGDEARPAERSVSRVLCMATILLGPSLPAGSSDQPGVIARATRPLSGLASGGVCRARSVTGAAVRSYRTVSPLPTLRWAVCFLLHCPASHLDWPLTSTLPCEARTFLSRRHLRTATSGHLDLSVERAGHRYSPRRALSNRSAPAAGAAISALRTALRARPPAATPVRSRARARRLARRRPCAGSRAARAPAGRWRSRPATPARSPRPGPRRPA
jgi:hypothetical protein